MQKYSTVLYCSKKLLKMSQKSRCGPVLQYCKNCLILETTKARLNYAEAKLNFLPLSRQMWVSDKMWAYA